MRAWATASIGARLTAWSAAVLRLMLLVHAGITFLAVRHAFPEQLDDQLRDDFETAAALLTRSAEGRVVWGGGREEPDAATDRVYEVWAPTARSCIDRAPGCPAAGRAHLAPQHLYV